MKPAPFRYVAARSIEQALALKAEHGDEARFLAGGQSLIPALNFRLARPAVLIDINGLAELSGIDRSNATEVRVGALTRYRALERNAGLLASCPLFADALPHIAHPQIRNRGTIGGNLSHADPASELPALAVAMQATMQIKSATGERRVPASEFFVGLLTTDLQSDEMLVDVTFPVLTQRSGTCFMEIARRRGDFAIAGVAAIVTHDEERRCSAVRLALCGVGETAVDASGEASSMIGRRVTGEIIEEVATRIQETIAPPGNVHASPDYQRHIARVLTQRALRMAYQRINHAA